MTRLNLNLNQAAKQLILWKDESKKEDSVFSTGSSINPVIEGENKIVMDHLQAGNRINCGIGSDMDVTFLDNRIADLRRMGFVIHSRLIRLQGSICNEYCLTPFEISTNG